MNLKIELSVREPIPAQTDGTITTLHFTGGLTGVACRNGWAIAPVSHEGQPHFVGFVPINVLSKLFEGTGIHPICYVRSFVIGGIQQTHVEEWVNRADLNPETTHVLWQRIATNVAGTSPEAVANKARHITIGLTNVNAGIGKLVQLFNDNLTAAIRSGKKEGLRFSNLSDLSIAAAVHDFYAALGTARDHIAGLIALRLGLPDSKDDLERLRSALKKVDDPDDSMFKALAAAGHFRRADDEWKVGDQLTQMGNVRKRFVHKQPYGAYQSEIDGEIHTEVDAGEILIKGYKRSLVIEDKVTVDLMERITTDYRNLMRFAEVAARASGYSTNSIIVEDPANLKIKTDGRWVDPAESS